MMYLIVFLHFTITNCLQSLDNIKRGKRTHFPMRCELVARVMDCGASCPCFYEGFDLYRL